MKFLILLFLITLTFLRCNDNSVSNVDKSKDIHFLISHVVFKSNINENVDSLVEYIENQSAYRGQIITDYNKKWHPVYSNQCYSNSDKAIIEYLVFRFKRIDITENVNLKMTISGGVTVSESYPVNTYIDTFTLMQNNIDDDSDSLVDEEDEDSIVTCIIPFSYTNLIGNNNNRFTVKLYENDTEIERFSFSIYVDLTFSSLSQCDSLGSIKELFKACNRWPFDSTITLYYRTFNIKTLVDDFIFGLTSTDSLDSTHWLSHDSTGLKENGYSLYTENDTLQIIKVKINSSLLNVSDTSIIDGDYLFNTRTRSPKYWKTYEQKFSFKIDNTTPTLTSAIRTFDYKEGVSTTIYNYYPNSNDPFVPYKDTIIISTEDYDENLVGNNIKVLSKSATILYDKNHYPIAFEKVPINEFSIGDVYQEYYLLIQAYDQAGNLSETDTFEITINF